MGSIQHEIVHIGEAAFQVVDQIGRRFKHPATVMTDHVDVIILGWPVGGRAVAQVRMPYQPDGLEQLKRPVDSREIDLRDGVPELFRGGMAKFAHRSQNAIPLRGHSQAARVQLGGEIDRRVDRRVRVVDVLVFGHCNSS